MPGGWLTTDRGMSICSSSLGYGTAICGGTYIAYWQRRVATEVLEVAELCRPHFHPQLVAVPTSVSIPVVSLQVTQSLTLARCSYVSLSRGAPSNPTSRVDREGSRSDVRIFDMVMMLGVVTDATLELGLGLGLGTRARLEQCTTVL